MKICAITHPVPKIYAKRIYDDDKTIFVCKNYLNKINDNGRFVLYESRGIGAYTGWADIDFMQKMEPKKIINVYRNDLFLTEDELKEYSKKRTHMTIIRLKNFEKFRNPVFPKKFITMSGKYIDREEYEYINKNKG